MARMEELRDAPSFFVSGGAIDSPGHKLYVDGASDLIGSPTGFRGGRRATCWGA